MRRGFLEAQDRGCSALPATVLSFSAAEEDEDQNRGGDNDYEHFALAK
ncbi:MAG: hypothetical protein ACYS21_02390 [Planctomycetota bacterium]